MQTVATTQTLDEKLTEILETHRDATPHPYATKIWVREIKQAFADADYLPIADGIKRYLDAGADKKFYIVSQEYIDKQLKESSLIWRGARTNDENKPK